jgi:hypothetical protein
MPHYCKYFAPEKKIPRTVRIRSTLVFNVPGRERERERIKERESERESDRTNMKKSVFLQQT